MPVETAVAMAALSLPVLVGLGWAAAVSLLLLGRARHARLLLGSGQVLAGVMLLATTEVLYLHDAFVQGGALLVQTDDLLALGLIGMAAGLVVMLGLGTAWSGPSRGTVRGRASAAAPAKR